MSLSAEPGFAAGRLFTGKAALQPEQYFAIPVSTFNPQLLQYITRPLHMITADEHRSNTPVHGGVANWQAVEIAMLGYACSTAKVRKTR
jgi:hypothetical protein